jgi:hypothetical protein
VGWAGAAVLLDGLRVLGPLPAPRTLPPAPSAAPTAAAMEDDTTQSQPVAHVPLPTVTRPAPTAAAVAAHTLPRARLRFPRTAAERVRLSVFRDLWQRGHYLTAGVKFGGDYLVYPGEPSRFHAHYVAWVQRPDQARPSSVREGGWCVCVYVCACLSLFSVYVQVRGVRLISARVGYARA